MKISLDTNVLLDEPNIVLDKSREFVISFTVVRELDKLKRNPEIKRAAQSAIINIWNLYKEDEIEILNIPELLADSPDECIVTDTKNGAASLLSNDIGARIIAKAHGVPISDFESESEIDEDYTGYVTVQGTNNYEQDFVQIKEMQLVEFNTQFNVDLKQNQYCIIDRVIEKNDIWHHRNGRVHRISQSIQPLKSTGIMAVPLDSEQWCALHAVMDPEVPLTIIDGKLGTGKTLIGLMGVMACTFGQKSHQHYRKILVTRPPLSIDHSYKLGYLPGDLSEKLGDWIGGIKSNLEFLLDTQKKDKDDVKLSDKVFEEFFEMLNMDSIQGLSVHDSPLVIDEYQLMNDDMLFLALSRIAKGSKVVLLGDTRSQTYGMNRFNEGFKSLYKYHGKLPEMSFIRLDNIHRSALAKVVDEIFQHRR